MSSKPTAVEQGLVKNRMAATNNRLQIAQAPKPPAGAKEQAYNAALDLLEVIELMRPHFKDNRTYVTALAQTNRQIDKLAKSMAGEDGKPWDEPFWTQAAIIAGYTLSAGAVVATLLDLEVMKETQDRAPKTRDNLGSMRGQGDVDETPPGLEAWSEQESF